MVHRLTKLCVLTVLAGLAACSRPETLQGDARSAFMEQFRNGETELTCVVSCSGQWGYNRRVTRAQHDAGDWAMLAITTAQIGYDGQLAWYYLGRAAEGMGAYEAASRYYKRAKFHGHPCDQVLNVCDGFALEPLIDERLAGLVPEPVEQAEIATE